MLEALEDSKGAQACFGNPGKSPGLVEFGDLGAEPDDDFAGRVGR
jgi:hypothetical protein